MESKKILAPGIVLYNDFDLAEKILNPFKELLKDKWSFAEVVNTENYSIEISKSRVCQQYGISNAVPEISHLSGMIDSFITPKVDDYKIFYSVEKTKDDGWLALKYDVGGKFDHHIDDGAMFPRTVSVSAYLNDDYDGGEIEFLHFGILHKPVAGDIIVFSSSFPYLHKVHPVTNGTRYTIVNWYTYPRLERSYV